MLIYRYLFVVLFDIRGFVVYKHTYHAVFFKTLLIFCSPSLLFASLLAANSAEGMEEALEAEEEEDDLEEQADYGPEDGVDRENEDGELMVTSVEQGVLLENENLQVRAQVRESFGGDESAVE